MLGIVFLHLRGCSKSIAGNDHSNLFSLALHFHRLWSQNYSRAMAQNLKKKASKKYKNQNPKNKKKTKTKKKFLVFLDSDFEPKKCNKDFRKTIFFHKHFSFFGQNS